MAWGWDNTKLIIWAYFICLPFLWRELILKWPWPLRAGVCFVLFASGFVSLIGGLATGRPGFDIANRTELEAVATVVRELPIKERFATYPTYNHPLLMGDENLSASAIRMGSCAKDFVSCFPAFLIQDSGLALGW